MRFIADFHIHSKYSRAVSKDMVLEELDRWADDKGILVMGTGDFTHPAWFRELKEKLEPAEPGLYKLKPQFKLKTIKGTEADTRFILTVEISSIYSRGGRTRRVHNLVFAPDLETAEKINTQLSWIGNIASDGRPILGLDSEELAKIVFNINQNAIIIPAHAWTPWFSVFGSMSGFDALEECFGAYSKNIFAVETGLSSDPAMNWRWSKLDNIALISNSDSHSLERIGREANIFNTEISYQSIMEALRSRDPKKFVSTIEFFPEEGKYHYDGHRLCNVSWAPEETKKHRNLCSKCGKAVTVGVMNRVHALADRPEIKRKSVKVGEITAQHHENRVPYVNLVTLDTIIGEAFDLGPKTKTVKTEYDKLIKAFNSELHILMNVPARDLSASAKPEVVEGIERVRAGKLAIEPGYDGEFGKIKIFSDADRKKIKEQKSLF
ncbi:MAG TPA: endonuclease Q family protein [Candidatus Paceibacterota bacterium]